MPIATDCPAPDVLQAFLLGRLTAAAVDQLAAHVENCAHCVARLHGLQAHDGLVEAIQVPAPPREEKTNVVLDGLMERLCDLHTRTGDTWAPSRLPVPAGQQAGEITQELYDFLAPPQEPGEIGRLGSYRVLKVLGVGGMGIVFEAVDSQLQRSVALKTMKPVLAASPSAGRRFLREVRAIAGIEHDHIITILHVGEERGVPFLAMPLLQGETLDDRLKREGKLPVAEVVRIGLAIAEGLAAAHDRGVIHRDVKPSNIWLETGEGRVKILDFGLARAVSDEIHLTQSGIIAGTPAYMAPEQAHGEAQDARCDLFSLGVVLYHLCTGELPFKGANTMGILRALEMDRPRPPHTLNPAVPRALADLILQLIAKKPQDRLPSARAVVEALTAIQHGRTLSIRPNWRRWRWSLAAVVLLGILGLASYAFGPAVLALFQSEAEQADDHKSTDSLRPCHFGPQVSYAVGPKPYAVAVGDFNGDGKLDLAVSNSDSNTVSILLGNGDGTFRKSVDYPAGARPHGVTVGDFNGDGKPDLAVANPDTGTVSVLVGNGDGSFRAPVSYATGAGARGVAAGDVNDDGKLDLVVTNMSDNTVSVLLGNDDGSFRKAVNYRVTGSPISVAVADVNGDGKLDLVASGSSGSVVFVLLGKGDGTFGEARPYGVGSGPGIVVVADFNGDGRPDIAVENFGSHDVSVLLGNGDGTFQPAVSYGAGSGPGGLAVGDFNGDGVPDLVVANHNSFNLSVLLGKGDGTFRSPLHYAVGNTPAGVAVGDFNGDGRPDVAVANHLSADVSVLLNKPPTPHFYVTAVPQFASGAQATVAIIALDPWGVTNIAYTGTVHITSSDPQAVLPGDYTFRPDINGSGGVLITLKTPGPQTITATDIRNGQVTGSTSVIVTAPPSKSK